MHTQVSGTGHAGMEAAIANCIEAGETIVVANAGIWGQRVCDLSERYGGQRPNPLPRSYQHKVAHVHFMLVHYVVYTLCCYVHFVRYSLHGL